MDGLLVTSSFDNGKLQEELTERTAEISRMRDQMSQQQSELEEVRGKLKSYETLKNSFDAASHELVCVKYLGMYLVIIGCYGTSNYFLIFCLK